jgi:hypothetical protein
MGAETGQLPGSSFGVAGNNVHYASAGAGQEASDVGQTRYYQAT